MPDSIFQRLFKNLFTGDRKFIYLGILSLLTIAGASLRIFGILDNGLGYDDNCHIWLASGPNLWAIIEKSYTDAHPPLRNIIMHLFIVPFTEEPFYLRLVSMMPGILLIPIIYLLVVKLTNNRAVALLGSLTVAFSSLWILLSQGTRPYTLAAVFLLVYIYSLEMVVTHRRSKYYWLFFIFGFLLISTDYGVIGVTLSLSLIALTKVFYKTGLKSTIPLILITSLHLLWFLAQISLVYQFSVYRPDEYVKEMPIAPHALLSQIIKIFNHNFFQADLLSVFMFLIFICCVLICITKKQWSLLTFGILPLIALIFMSYFRLYPFIPGRWTILYSLVQLLFICRSLSFFYEQNNLWKNVSLVFLIAGIGINLFSSSTPLSFNSPKSIKKSSYWEKGNTEFEYRQNAFFLKDNIKPGDIMFTSTQLEKNLRSNLPLSSYLLSAYHDKRLKKFSCLIRFQDCINEVQKAEKNSNKKPRYILILSHYDLSNQFTQKKFNIKIVNSYKPQSTTGNTYIFTIN